MTDDASDRSRRLPLILSLLLLSPLTLTLAQSATSDSGVSIWQIVLLIFLLILSGFMSGSETALTAIGAWKIRQLREDGEDPSGVFGMLERDPTRFITTLLIANNVVNIAATALVTQIAISLSRDLGFSESLAVGYATGIMTILVLIFGEITPKSIAVHNAVAFSRFVIRPVYALSIILYPLGRFFTWITSNMLRMFRLEPSENPLITENELRLMLRSAEESGVIESQEQEMIKGIIDLEETVVREVMTPRVDVIAVALDAPLSDLLMLIREHGYSRLPVYQETVDNVRGIVYARDLLNYLDGNDSLTDTPVSSIMQAPQYVPGTLSILNLLRDMRSSKNHMAIVVDEFGGTAGLITLEDIIEEITGEIYDETDEDEAEDIITLDDNHYRIQGSAHTDEVGSVLKINFEDEGEYDTLAGFLTNEFGYIPAIGETLEYEHVKFMIEDADERRVTSVLVYPLDSNPVSSEDDTTTENS